MSALEAIRVISYSLAGTGADVGPMLKRADDFVKSMESSGWEPMIAVRDDDERVYMHTKASGDRMVGLSVFVAEPGDSVTLINIVGDFDAAQLGRLLGSLDINDGMMDGLMEMQGLGGAEDDDDSEENDDAEGDADDEAEGGDKADGASGVQA